MRPGQQNNNGNNNNKNRQRGRNNNGGRKHMNPLSRNYESNGPDVKVRGNAAHIAEKYVQLARDAHSSGDSVMAENYLQHAEHYFRIVLAAQPQVVRTDQFGAPEYDAEDGEEDYSDETADRFEIPQFRQQQPQQNERQGSERQGGERQNGERQFDRNRDDRGGNGERQPRFEQPARDEQPRTDARSDEQQPRPDALVEANGAEPVMADGEVSAEGAVPQDGEPRRVRERRPRRRRQSTEAMDPSGPQPDVGELPAFITAPNPAE